MRKFTILFCLSLIFSGIASQPSWAGEITYTGSAGIANGDIRAAQKSSLHNALLGGVRRYIQVNVPDRRGDITDDYFVFIKSYAILQRDISGNAVRTRVRIVLDDTITEDVAAFMIAQVNTAVFTVKGLNEYVKLADIRKGIADLFADRQFSTKDQIPFEQEIIDINSDEDITNAFQSVSSQYLFNFNLTLRSYKAGESCTMVGESNYVSINAANRKNPIIRTEITVDEADLNQCITMAMHTSIDNALAHVRDKMIPVPGDKTEVLEYKLTFTDIKDQKTLNDVLDTLQRRMYIVGYEIAEVYGDEAIFDIKSYLVPLDLSRRIYEQHFESIEEITVDFFNENVKLDMM